MQVKRVKWRDSNIYSDQTNKDTEFKVAIIESIGFLVKETKDSVVLARDYLDEEDIRGTIIIPKENIIKS